MASINFSLAGPVPALTPLSSAPSVSISGLGEGSLGHLSNVFASFRTWLALPPSDWTPRWITDSPYYPDLPNSIGFQCLGITTFLHAYLGPRALWRAVCSRAESGWDKFHKTLDVVVALAQTALGFGYGAFRLGNVAQAVATAQGNLTAAAMWGNVAQTAGMAGTFGCICLYAPLSINGGVRAIRSARLFHGIPDRAVHLEKLYLATDAELLKENGNTPAVLQTAAKVKAFAEQKELWKGGLAFIKKHGGCNEDAALPEAEEDLEQAIKKKLGGEAGVIEHGKKLLLEDLQKRKITNLTQLIGKKGVEVLGKAQRKVDGSLDLKPIELSKIEASRSDITWRYAGECFIYALGALSMALLCVYTVGTPLLIGSILCAITFTAEAYLSYKDLKNTKEDISSPPGNYDKVWPVISSAICLAAIGTAIGLSTVFSLGTVPLALTIAGGVIWLCMNYHQLGCIDMKRGQYIQSLLVDERRGTLQPAEFAYIIANGTTSQVKQARDHGLSWVHRRGIVDAERELNSKDGRYTGPKTAAEGRRRLRSAVGHYIVQSQVTLLQKHLQPALVAV